ncbi:hypothetical protein DFH08DRAFT_815139 [Mycena albidolilacea]|uniref:Uncharacterized protein n=1 Tax=Mycena albidolilacea TaxID=1033008 RepID=A0AAD6ZNK8_9AGAR|nr:hypothetical protein DFH08DRAFT_815139 [Mycena albidolilacea]
MPEDVRARVPDEQENDLGEWVDLHTNRIGPVNGSVLLYRKNGCSDGGQRGPTEPAVHIQRWTGCGSEVCKVSGKVAGFCVHGWFDFSDRDNVFLNEHTVIGGKGFGRGQSGGNVGNAHIVVGRDLSASVLSGMLPPVNMSNAIGGKAKRGIEKQRRKTDAKARAKRENALDALGILTLFGGTGGDVVFLKKDKVSALACELEGLRCQIKLLMWGLRSAWMGGASLQKATVLHCKRGGWAKIAAGMVGGGKEEENGSAADGSVERYKSAEMGRLARKPRSSRTTAFLVEIDYSFAARPFHTNLLLFLLVLLTLENHEYLFQCDDAQLPACFVALSPHALNLSIVDIDTPVSWVMQSERMICTFDTNVAQFELVNARAATEQAVGCP